MKATHCCRGVIVPMVTPFTPDGEIDRAAVGRIVEHLITGGVHGIFVLGTTGEAVSVSSQDRCTLVEEAVRAAARRMPIFAGVSANCFRESVEAAAVYRRIGAAAVVAHPPFYYPLPERDIETWFLDLADAVPLPLLLYNIPQTTHQSIPLDAVERLSGHANIVGIKDSANDGPRLNELLRRRAVAGEDDGFTVLVGAGSLYTTGLRGGAHGIVPSTGNLDPASCRALFDAAAAGDWDAMEQAYRRVLDVTATYQQGRLLGESLAALKALMAARGLCGPGVLPPLRELPHA